MKTKLVENIRAIGAGVKMDADFKEKNGQDWEVGYPAKNAEGKILGYVDRYPNSDEDFNEALKSFVSI